MGKKRIRGGMQRLLYITEEDGFIKLSEYVIYSGRCIFIPWRLMTVKRPVVSRRMPLVGFFLMRR